MQNSSLPEKVINIKTLIENVRTNPFSVFHHKRLILAYIGQGQLEQALLAWDTALDLTKNKGSYKNRSWYLSFHKQVATALLNKNEKEGAKYILNEVPHWILESSFKDITSNLKL